MTYSLLRRAIRLIAGLRYRDECRQAFVDLGILTPVLLHTAVCAICKRKHQHFLHPQIHGYNTREDLLTICYNIKAVALLEIIQTKNQVVPAQSCVLLN
nr:unnamed protein product [Callosobruchus analis]